nr:hypothetical protein [Tanacetum cinerariifolium]
MEDQPLLADASPTALSPGYIVNSNLEKDEKDPKGDPAYYPADRGNNDDDESSNDDDNDDDVENNEEDKEEEEHLAPADPCDVSTDDLDPADYPADRGNNNDDESSNDDDDNDDVEKDEEDKEDEEHLAPADPSDYEKDPKEDPADYPADRGDTDDDDESSNDDDDIILSSQAENTETFETDESASTPSTIFTTTT